MAFKMKNGSMAKMVKEAGNNRVSPMKKDKLPTPEEDKALLAKLQKEKNLSTETEGPFAEKNKKQLKKVRGAYTREVNRDVKAMSRKEARQEVRADRKEGRAERKAYKKNVKRNMGGAFAGGAESKSAGKNVPGAFSSKKKKKSYLAAKKYKEFDNFVAGVSKTRKRKPGSEEK
tara:strand:- start:417 stop:938 length:522 start_codon:yes stop_codon:yes gene_type:complete